jgi:hypothetical protein
LYNGEFISSCWRRKAEILMEEIAKRILEEIPNRRFVRHCNIYLQLLVVEEGGRDMLEWKRSPKLTHSRRFVAIVFTLSLA